MPPQTLTQAFNSIEFPAIAQAESGDPAMTDATEDFTYERPVRPALLRGWRRRCPACGQGQIFHGYLKVRPNCLSCGEALHHQRADDGPAYMTILIVGHLMAPLILWAFMHYRPDPLVLASVFTAGCVALSLFLLPRLKGGLVALQWAKRMYGFGGPDNGR